MTRQLRPRKGVQSYAEPPIEVESRITPAGPSNASDDVDSESDFSPDKDAEGVPDDEFEGDVMDEDNGIVSDEPEIDPEPKVKGKAKGKGKATPQSTPKAKAKKPPKALTASSRHTLPTPSVHHRHRAAPLFSHANRVERLTAPPYLFVSPQTALTNSFAHNSQVSDRINRAWGHNVGSGPLWQLVEDRRWFKEAKTTGYGVEEEAKRRPRVYDYIPVKAGWQILDQKDGATYLPTANETTEEGSFMPPPPVSCYFGPAGSQVLREVQIMESFPLSEYIPESSAHVFNGGAPVWAIDWCPIHAGDRAARSYKQYLAVAPFPNSSHSPDIGTKVQRPSASCIQIWSLSRTKPIPNNKDPGQMTCEMVLCVDNGPALDMKWCPLPSHDIVGSDSSPKKLGLLGGTFEDGSFCVYVVPDPEDVGSNQEGPTLVKLEPILRIELPETACWSFDWANSERIAIGTTHGIIAVYDIGRALSSYQDPNSETVTKIRPTHYLTIHQSAIRALAWMQTPSCDTSGSPNLTEDPTVIASGGYDGVECLTDIREGRGFIMNRTRDVINTLTFSPFAAGPITMDHENTVKSYAASPSMLGRGHTLLEPLGPVWCVNASEYHPQLAVAAADGSCSTTNTLRSPRRGGTVPFFVHKIYQMDYSRNTQQFRMLDRFLPQEVPDARSAVNNAKKAKTAAGNSPSGTGAWSKHVGIHRVCWNNANGLGSSGLLASGGASGLCRIDMLWGRWINEKVPYGNVARVRMENGEDMDVDDRGSEASESDLEYMSEG